MPTTDQPFRRHVEAIELVEKHAGLPAAETLAAAFQRQGSGLAAGIPLAFDPADANRTKEPDIDAGVEVQPRLVNVVGRQFLVVLIDADRLPAIAGRRLDEEAMFLVERLVELGDYPRLVTDLDSGQPFGAEAVDPGLVVGGRAD